MFAMQHLPAVIWPLGFSALAIATVATAIVQLLKDLLPIRRRFQRSFLAGWFSERHAAGSKPVTHQQLLDAEVDLIRLSTGGDRSAFYDLEPPQLCGQMNAAAQIALSYPDRHPFLIRLLAPEADEKDIKSIVDSAGVDASQAAGTDVNEVLDARNRVTHHLQRTIDALQISMGFRWKFYVQIAIYVICFVLAFLCVFTANRSRFTVLEWIAVGVVAGFVSPVISDLATAVNRWRRA